MVRYHIGSSNWVVSCKCRPLSLGPHSDRYSSTACPTIRQVQFARNCLEQTLADLVGGKRGTEDKMKIADIMSSDVQLASPDETIQAVAKKMAHADIGFLPVGENDKLVGMITDRDIALRAVALGKDPKKTKVRDVMTERVLYCSDSEAVEDAAENMAELGIRRLPIVDDSKRLVGVVSIGDIALRHKASVAGDALESVCKPAA